VVVAVALPTTEPSLDARAWARLGLALAAGSIPFTLFGVALGYWLPPKAALPAANVLYLSLSYAGGLWTGPTGLPHAVAELGRVLPTRQWGEVLWAATRSGSWAATPWLALAAYTIAFALLAIVGYRKDEGRRYR
jgi:ABC-2 type transport system permease protein